MAGNREAQELARRWLIRARGSLELAHHPKGGNVQWEDLGFNAQQAAEKALKAVLVWHGVQPPKTHDAAELIRALQEKHLPVPPKAEELTSLTAFAVEARYPGAGFPEVSEEDYRGALGLATVVVDWAEKLVDSPL